MILKQYICLISCFYSMPALTAQDTLRDIPVWAVPEGSIELMSDVRMQEIREEYDIFPLSDTLSDVFRCGWSDIGMEEGYTILTTYADDRCKVFVYGTKMGLGYVGKHMPDDEPRHAIGAWRTMPRPRERP